VTHAVSSDGARTFQKPLAPAHTVAPPPKRWTAPAARTTPNWFGKYLEGYTAPTSIVHAPDGYNYALVQLNPDKETSEVRDCVMREPRPPGGDERAGSRRLHRSRVVIESRRPETNQGRRAARGRYLSR
jgi:hypothetical protein